MLNLSVTAVKVLLAISLRVRLFDMVACPSEQQRLLRSSLDTFALLSQKTLSCHCKHLFLPNMKTVDFQKRDGQGTA